MYQLTLACRHHTLHTTMSLPLTNINSIIVVLSMFAASGGHTDTRRSAGHNGWGLYCHRGSLLHWLRREKSTNVGMGINKLKLRLTYLEKEVLVPWLLAASFQALVPSSWEAWALGQAPLDCPELPWVAEVPLALVHLAMDP